MTLTLDNWIGIAGTLIGLGGLGYSIFVNKQKKELIDLNSKLELELKTITIDDIKHFAEDALVFLKNWKPEVVYCPDLRGGFVGYFLSEELGGHIPIITGFVFSKERPIVNCNIDGYYKELETPKYKILVGDYIHKYKGKRILIVDEIAITGEAIQALKAELLNQGFDVRGIKTMVVVACPAAIQSGRAPDFCWRNVRDHDVVFPWGRWR